MDIKQLRYFLQVYEHGSFSCAARKNYISAQGLNVSLLRLEAELSCQLFIRTPTGITLSEAGQHLLPYAQEIVANMDEVEGYYKQSTENQKLNIKIAAAYGAAPEVAGGLAHHFGQENPQYHIHITEYSDNDCDIAVEQGMAELGFAIGPINEEQFCHWELIHTTTCLLVHKDSPLAEMSSVSVDLLKEFDILAMNDKFKNTQTLMKCCADRGFEPRISFKASETSAIYRLVAQNLGIGISLRSVCKIFDNPNVVAIPFEEQELNWTIHLIQHRGRNLSSGGRAFKKYVLQHVDVNHKMEDAL